MPALVPLLFSPAQSQHPLAGGLRTAAARRWSVFILLLRRRRLTLSAKDAVAQVRAAAFNPGMQRTRGAESHSCHFHGLFRPPCSLHSFSCWLGPERGEPRKTRKVRKGSPLGRELDWKKQVVRSVERQMRLAVERERCLRLAVEREPYLCIERLTSATRFDGSFKPFVPRTPMPSSVMDWRWASGGRWRAVSGAWRADDVRGGPGPRACCRCSG